MQNTVVQCPFALQPFGRQGGLQISRQTVTSDHQPYQRRFVQRQVIIKQQAGDSFNAAAICHQHGDGGRLLRRRPPSQLPVTHRKGVATLRMGRRSSVTSGSLASSTQNVRSALSSGSDGDKVRQCSRAKAKAQPHGKSPKPKAHQLLMFRTSLVPDFPTTQVVLHGQSRPKAQACRQPHRHILQQFLGLVQQKIGGSYANRHQTSADPRL